MEYLESFSAYVGGSLALILDRSIYSSVDEALFYSNRLLLAHLYNPQRCAFLELEGLVFVP